MMTQEITPPAGAKNVVKDALMRHAKVPGALLPILHDIQDALGYIPSQVVPDIAHGLNLSRAEVHGVVTYYHHFRDQPAGRCLVQVCRAEACQSMGADALISHAAQRLDCAVHGTSADGDFSLEPAYCLGLCASSPAVMIGNQLHARVTPQSFDQLVANLEVSA
jgi:formate dehydrogenase subunit gamma